MGMYYTEILLFLGLVVGYSRAARCRMVQDAAHEQCGLPLELSNYQGYHECSDDVLIGRPKNMQQLKEMVKGYDKVKGVGVGHSWWKESFCSGNDTNSINIVMTEFENVIQTLNKFDMQDAVDDDNFPIKISTDKKSVTVAAGVSQRVLLDFLADYTGENFERGYSLGAFSLFIDQTIGGAVATGTHGSSFKYASLSNQLSGVKLLIANGSEISITRTDNQHLWNAVGVSVGRLGIITQLTLNILPQQTVQRRIEESSVSELIEKLTRLVDEYKLALETGDNNKIYSVLQQYEQTNIVWYVALKSVQWMTFKPLPEEQPVPVQQKEQNSNVSRSFQSAIENEKAVSELEGVFLQKQTNTDQGPPNPLVLQSAQQYEAFLLDFYKQLYQPGIFSSREGYLTLSQNFSSLSSESSDYEHYEVSIPLEHSAECIEGLVKALYGPRKLFEGIRGPFMIRFVGEEDYYISNTNGGPAMYLTLDDQLVHNGGDNQKIQEVLSYLWNNCDARLHWGKGRLEECYDGASKYKHWCDFGCAVQELDPAGKFSSESAIWQWRAQKNGQDVPFMQCCQPSGFSSECTCAASTDC